MKRILVIIWVMVSTLYGVLAFSQGTTQDEGKKDGFLDNVLIDFGQYEELNSKQGSPYLKAKPDGWEKDTTKYLITQEDMSLSNWVVRFNPSADTTTNKNNSYIKKVQTKGGETVLGVRIHYPNTRYNAYAEVMPLYEIMEYNQEGDFSNVGNGVLDNVGVLKALSVEVSGRNVSNGLYIRLIDKDRKFHDFFLGYLDFVGWRRLVWENPHYINSINQRDFVKVMLYPQDRPYLKFHSFLVSRINNELRGDFVAYFKRVEASYDKATINTDFLDIDDEKIWGIQKHKTMLRRAVELKRQSSKHLLRELELKKQGKQNKSDVSAKGSSSTEK